jgi:recombination associated protein RdgC
VFKNVMVYRMVSPWTMTQAQLEEALHPARFVPCAASQEKSVGWLEPRGEEHGPLVEVVGGHWLLRQMVEVKSVPGSVVKRKVEEQVRHIEATSGRKPGRKEVRELREDMRMSLLPLAFTKQAALHVWINPRAQLLVLEPNSRDCHVGASLCQSQLLALRGGVAEADFPASSEHCRALDCHRLQ